MIVEKPPGESKPKTTTPLGKVKMLHLVMMVSLKLQNVFIIRVKSQNSVVCKKVQCSVIIFNFVKTAQD